MSTKKYLSLEEAAGLLKIKTDELIRLREKGEVRGFADRGTWKFKAEDIQELGRRRQPDSSPEVPMLADDDDLGQQQTIISKGRGQVSDSDVRLVPDERFSKKMTGSSGELPVLSDSDSDVRLTDEPLAPSDSDVRLVAPKAMTDSDSDVRLSPAASDSDVKLVPPLSSDSDVKLVDRGSKKKSSDSDVALLPTGPASGKSSGRSFIDFDDSALEGGESVLLEDSGMALASESGIRLGGGSSIRLPGDSGINLTAPADSGILLEGEGVSGFPLAGESSATFSHGTDSELAIDDDSGIALDDDSGIKLGGPDSGIRLHEASGIKLKGDSGIRLSSGPRSGVKKGKPKDDLDSGVPLLLSKEDAGRTDVEVPMLDEEDELQTIDLSPKKGRKGDTSVVMLDDDETPDFGGSYDDDDQVALSDGGTDEDDELEVADDILGEDDELEQLEVFDSDDSVFEESFVEGGSAVGLNAPASRIAVQKEEEWGTATLSLLAASTLVLSVGAIVGVDLLRTVWGNPGGAVYSGEVIGIFAGLFK